MPHDDPRSDRDNRDLLIRLTTKFEAMEEKFEDVSDHLKSMERKLEDSLKSIRDDADKKFMTKDQFKPYQEVLDEIRKKVTAAVVSGVVAALLAVGAFPLYYSAFQVYKANVPAQQQTQQVGK